jgi:hypothetical protein
MRSTPSLNARNVNGVAEVGAVLGLTQPSGLAGGLAGISARSRWAIALAITVARVGGEKLPAAQALTLYGLRHGHSSTRPQKSATTANCNTLEEFEENAERPEEDASKTIFLEEDGA